MKRLHPGLAVLATTLKLAAQPAFAQTFDNGAAVDKAEAADFEVLYQLQQNRCSERPQSL